MNDSISRWSGLAVTIGGPIWLLPWTGWLGDIGDATAFMMAIVGHVLIVVGLFGLYRSLSAGGQSGRKTMFFGIALAGDLMLMASAIGGLLTGASMNDPGEYPILVVLLGAGVLIVIVGLAGMGIVATSEKALGALSFTPLLLAIALIGYVVSIGIDVAGAGDDDTLRIIANVVTIGSWLLFGAALWSGARAPAADPALRT